MALKDRYLVSLDLEQRQLLERMSRTGTHAARALAHARILLTDGRHRTRGRRRAG